MDKLIGVFFAAFIGLIFIFVFALFFAFITKLAWAYSVVPVFHFPELTYWQAYAFNILGGMLCKSSSGGKS